MEDAASERRLFLQGICCDYLLFRHLDEGVPPEAIRIRQEVALGDGVFADIEVRAGQAPPYFVEVDTGYSAERLLESMRRKYGSPHPATDGAARVVVVVGDGDTLGDLTAVERSLRETLRPGWPSRSGTSPICSDSSVSALTSRSTASARTTSSPSETPSTTPRASMPLATGSRTTPSRPPSSGTSRSGACAGCARPVGACPARSCRRAFAGMSSS